MKEGGVFYVQVVLVLTLQATLTSCDRNVWHEVEWLVECPVESL